MRNASKRRSRLRRSRNRRVRSLRSRLPSAHAVASGLATLARRGVAVWIALSAVGAMAGALGLGYAWLTSSQRFEIDTVEVRGAERLATDRVRAIAAVPAGTNVFTADLAGVERRLTAHPWIESAVVDRKLPDRIAIDLVERTPAALVELDGLYLAQTDGHVFKRAAISRGEGDGLPIITGIDRDDYLAHPEAAEAAIRTALATLSEYERGGGRPAVGEVHVDPRRGITLLTHDTALALALGHGYEARMAAQLTAFDTAWHALSDHERARARVIFMDNEANPDRITVRFGGTH